GSAFPVEVSSVRADLDGSPLVLSLIRDMTARKRRSLLTSLLARLDHAVLRGGDLSAALEELSRTMARELKAERVTVVLTSSEGADHADETSSSPSGSALCLPLLAQGSRVGTLEILAAEGSPAAQYDQEALAEFAQQLGATLATARHQERLRLMESALESVVNAIAITDAQGCIQWVNPAFTTLTGYQLDEVRGQNPRILKSGVHSPRLYESMWATLLQGQVWRGEMKNRRKDGTLYDEEMTITPLKDANGTIRHFIAIKQDVTKRKLDEERIQHLSTTDSLTGLANRRALEQRLAALASLASSRFTSALFVLDIDQFKAINDSFGIEAGDRLLVAVAHTLKTTLRDRGAVARLGDDEYAVLLPSATKRDAQDLVRELTEAVEAIRIHQGDRVIEPTISIGVTQVDGTKSGYELLIEAERALLAAKSRGTGRVEFFARTDDPQHQISGALVEWAARIRHGVRNDRFVLHFQPVVHLKTGKAEHAEALVRLRDSNGVVISPGQFITIAETLHLMPLIDRWVIDQAIDRMRENHDLRIFVNLSAQSLGDRELRDHASRMLLLHPHVARRLTFEVTETSALRHFAGVREWMELLRSLGCRFALDDFGSGFSSFAYLRELPVDYVKLDGSFVRVIDKDPSCLAVVRALVDVSHTMGKTVIAEWVENHRIAHLLAGLGVEYGQGFALGRPGTSLDFPTLPPLKTASS
ncbi:MAG: putative bifunctional diguanylate cyclase/phosphodiesterase, partial [Bacillota bacterium]